MFSEEVCDVKVWAGQYSHFKLQKSDEETRVIFLNREKFEKITKNRTEQTEYRMHKLSIEYPSTVRNI